LTEAERSELAAYIDPLRDLLVAFARGAIAGALFESEFFRIYQTLEGIPSPAVFEAIERYFGDVDDYVSDPDLREGPGDLTTDELRARTIALLETASTQVT
jgi:hypothetical protein